MNIQETEKIAITTKASSEPTTLKESAIEQNHSAVVEKNKPNNDNISIKAAKPINLRELFGEESNKPKKETSANPVQNIKEAEIKISKSTEEVIKIIRDSKKDLIKENKTINKPSNEQIKEDIELKKIIQEELNKSKIESVPQNESIETLKLKNTQSAKAVKTVLKPEPKETTTPTKLQHTETQLTNSQIKITRVATTSPTAKTQSVERSLGQKVSTEVQKTKEEKEASRPIHESVTANDKVEDTIEKILHEEREKKSSASRRGIVELSSLTPEEKREFYKSTNQTVNYTKRIIFFSIFIAIIVVAIFIINGSSGDDKEIVTKARLNNTTSQTEKTNINPVLERQEKTDSSIEPQKLGQPVTNVSNTAVPEPPPLTELPEISSPSVDMLLENSEDSSIKANILKEEKNIIPPKENKIAEEEPTFFVAVEQMPEPIGGLVEIQKRVVYPTVALQTGIQGKVYVRAMVNEAGIVTESEVIKGIGAGCDEAALTAVQKTKFKPGVQRGKPVKVQITIPIVFKKGN